MLLDALPLVFALAGLGLYTCSPAQISGPGFGSCSQGAVRARSESASTPTTRWLRSGGEPRLVDLRS